MYLLTGADHLANHLMAWDHTGPVHRQIALSHMQVGAAYPAGEHSHEQFAGSGPGRRFCYPEQRIGLYRSGLPHPPGPREFGSHVTTAPAHHPQRTMNVNLINTCVG
jgi:hypothetical protein